MTDRLRGVEVVFVKDIREDDAEVTIAAIKQIKGVLAVRAIVSDRDDWAAEQRVKLDLSERLWAVLYPKSP